MDEVKRRIYENQVELKKRQIQTLEKEKKQLLAEIEELETRMLPIRCQGCKKTCPPTNKRLVTTGGIYCLDCGFEVLDLLKDRNLKKEVDKTFEWNGWTYYWINEDYTDRYSRANPKENNVERISLAHYNHAKECKETEYLELKKKLNKPSL